MSIPASEDAHAAVIPRTEVERSLNRFTRTRGYAPKVSRGRPILALVAVAAAVGALSAGAATLPQPVANAVHGRVVGWTRTAPDWFAVYVEGKGSGWCGLDGASWWIALVASPPEAPEHTVAPHRIRAAICGNSLAWVRAGRFSDGKHREVAFMLWATPSIGATTYIYRIERNRLVRLASFVGDSVTLARGTVTAHFENSGRSPNGKIENVYRFSNGRYRLQK